MDRRKILSWVGRFRDEARLRPEQGVSCCAGRKGFGTVRVGFSIRDR